MWNSGEHSDEENIRWSWLRAVEWLEWPLFISQPVVPILLYFYRWPAVLGGVVAVAFLWRALVRPFWVVPSLANIGPQPAGLRRRDSRNNRSRATFVKATL
jgi:hypothetical protein